MGLIMMNEDELFLRISWLKKVVQTIVRDSHHREPATRCEQDLKVTGRIWTCAEPEFKLCWMKLYSSDSLYTTAPQQKRDP